MFIAKTDQVDEFLALGLGIASKKQQLDQFGILNFHEKGIGLHSKLILQGPILIAIRYTISGSWMLTSIWLYW